MNKSIKKNYIFNTCYQILLLIVPFITTPYLSRVLGVENIGLNSYATAIVSYFTLFCVLGTSSYGQREVSYTQGDKQKNSQIFFEIIIFRIVTTIITLLAYGIYILTVKDNLIIYLILSLNIMSCVIDITWFFQGLEEFQKTVTRNAIIKLLNIIFIFLFVKNEGDLVIYVAGTVILSFLGCLSLWPYLPKYICKPTQVKPFRNIKTIIKLFIPSIAIQIYTVLDKTMLGMLSSNEYLENGYYEQAEKIIKLTLTLITSLATVMVPRIGSIYKSGDIDKLKGYMYRSYKFVFLLSIPMMFGLMSVTDFLVPILFGAGYEKVVTLLPIFSILVVVIGLSNVNGIQYFVPIGKEKVFTLTVVSGAICNLILNSILIPRYYSIGACIASVISEILVAIIGFGYIFKAKELSVRIIFLSSIKNIIAGLVMFISVMVVKHFLSISIFNLVILIVLGVFVYFVMLIILKDEMLIEVYSRGLDILKSKRRKSPL